MVVVLALQTKSRDSVPATKSVGLNPGFLAFLTWVIRSSSLAETVDLMVLDDGSSICSPLRLLFVLIPGMVLGSEAVEELDEEELELDDVDELEQLESLSESELVGWPWILPLARSGSS